MQKWIISTLMALVSSWALAAGVVAEQAWARFSVPGMSMSGVFLDIRNQSGLADVLVGGSTAVADKVELHTHANDNGVMRMRALPQGIALPAGQTVQLQPGGLHVMLMGLKQPLKVGDTFALTLKFKQAKPQTVMVTVKTGADKATSATPHPHHGQASPHTH